MAVEKKRANGHRSRTGTNGKTISARHNDRNFDVSKSEHINEKLTKDNVFWTFDDTIKADTLDEYEQAFYEKNFSATLEKRNAKQIAARHKERVQTMEEFRQNPKACPEEVIWTIGNRDNRIDPDILIECFEDFLDWHTKNYPNVKFLDATLHMDEPNAAPHIHCRQVWVNEVDGVLEISQKKALDAMGIRRPNTAEKENRYNNAKVTYTQQVREKWLNLAETYGIDVERDAREPSKNGLALDKLKKQTLAEEIVNLQRQVDDTKLELANIPPRPVKPTEPIRPSPFDGNSGSKKEVREYNRQIAQYGKDLKTYKDKTIPEWEQACKEWDRQYGLMETVKRRNEEQAQTADFQRRENERQQAVNLQQQTEKQELARQKEDLKNKESDLAKRAEQWEVHRQLEGRAIAQNILDKGGYIPAPDVQNQRQFFEQLERQQDRDVTAVIEIKPTKGNDDFGRD